MYSHFNTLPTEINLIIAIYSDINEINLGHPLREIINDNWRLMFFLGFPDVDINQIEIIDFTSKDFDLMKFTYNRLMSIYEEIEDNIKYTLEDYQDHLDVILNDLDFIDLTSDKKNDCLLYTSD